jgi:hypothetical protein
MKEKNKIEEKQGSIVVAFCLTASRAITDLTHFDFRLLEKKR